MKRLLLLVLAFVAGVAGAWWLLFRLLAGHDGRPATRDGVQRCRECGCTDTTPCASGCWWVELDLCSTPACIDAVVEPLVADPYVADFWRGPRQIDRELKRWPDPPEYDTEGTLKERPRG